MFSKILVPLDGSILAEMALPYAVALANCLDAQLTLLTVLDRTAEESDAFEEGLRVPTTSDPINKLDFGDLSAALLYLDDVKLTLSDSALANFLPFQRISTLATYNKPLNNIAQIALEVEADLIVMATHGRGGLLNLVYGSTAAAVVHNSKLPVILIRPNEWQRTHSLENSLNLSAVRKALSQPVVVALDGSRSAEKALTPATQLATLLSSRLNLLRVVPDPPAGFGAGWAIPQPQTETLQFRKEATAYISKLQDKLAWQGVKCTGIVTFGEPYKKILEYAESLPAGLLVVSVRESIRVGQNWQNPLLEKIIHASTLPIMLINSRLYEDTARLVAEDTFTNPFATN